MCTDEGGQQMGTAVEMEVREGVGVGDVVSAVVGKGVGAVLEDVGRRRRDGVGFGVRVMQGMV